MRFQGIKIPKKIQRIAIYYEKDNNGFEQISPLSISSTLRYYNLIFQWLSINKCLKVGNGASIVSEGQFLAQANANKCLVVQVCELDFKRIFSLIENNEPKQPFFSEKPLLRSIIAGIASAVAYYGAFTALQKLNIMPSSADIFSIQHLAIPAVFAWLGARRWDQVSYNAMISGIAFSAGMALFAVFFPSLMASSFAVSAGISVLFFAYLEHKDFSISRLVNKIRLSVDVLYHQLNKLKERSA